MGETAERSIDIMEPKSLSRSHRQLISELRELRERADLSGAALGERLGWSQSKVSKIENGRTRPSAVDVERWAHACDADPDTVSRLIAATEALANEIVSWRKRGLSLADRNRQIGDAERAGTLLQNFQPSVIPGLLQTADYARRVYTMLDKAEEEIAAAVVARMERQTVLYDERKRFEFVLTEGALRWRPGPPSLLLAQLDRLTSIATLPNVLLGVLPFDREAPGLYLHGFTILSDPEDPFVLVELLAGDMKPYRQEDIEMFRVKFEQLRDAALTGTDAVAVIRKVMADLSAE